MSEPVQVSTGLAAQRYAICRKCPHMRKWRKTCKVCGCLLLTKVKFEQEYCPIKKW